MYYQSVYCLHILQLLDCQSLFDVFHLLSFSIVSTKQQRVF